MKKFLMLAVLLGSLWAGTAVAQQGPACVPRAELLQHLKMNYSEEPVAHGVAENGTLLEIFATPTGETWTAVVSMPSGISCLVASGNFWEVVRKKEGSGT